MFGTPYNKKFDWRWLYPSPAVFPDDVKDALFGFCLEKYIPHINENFRNICRDAELVALISSPVHHEAITADDYPASSSELKEYKAS